MQNQFLLLFLAPQVKGKDGSVGGSNVLPEDWKWKLDTANKRSFPLELINIMRRQAEDLLLSNKDSVKGRAALRFVLTLLNERSDLKEMKKGESV